MVPLQRAMKNPGNFRKVLAACFLTVSTICVLFGSTGYLAYGEKKMINFNSKMIK